jgi:hypothetical protein
MFRSGPSGPRLVHRWIVGRFGHEPEPRAEGARKVPPDPRRAVDFEDILLVRPVNEPRALREFTFELSTGPAGITNKRSNGVVLRDRELLGFLQGNVVTALQDARLRVPPKSGEEQLIGLDRSALQHGHAGELAERLVLQEIAHELAGGPIEDQAEAAIFHIVIREHDDSPMKVRVHHAGVSYEKTARQSGSNNRFTHSDTIARASARGK